MVYRLDKKDLQDCFRFVEFALCFSLVSFVHTMTSSLGLFQGDLLIKSLHPRATGLIVFNPLLIVSCSAAYKRFRIAR